MPLMNGFDPKKPAVMLRGPIGINLKPFLLLFAEYLADSGHNVMYITKSMSHIPPPLHGTTNKTEAFARINFRYLQNQEELLDTLSDVSFFEKLSKNSYTIIVDGLESYLNHPEMKDLNRVCATLLGAPPDPVEEIPRLVVGLNYDPNVRLHKALRNCYLLFLLIWDVSMSGNSLNIKRGKQLIQFQAEEISTSFGHEQLLKLKSVISSGPINAS